KKHLLDGVKKGALTDEQVEERFAKWLDGKAGKINSKKDNLSTGAKKAAEDKLKAETAAKEAKAAKIAAKNAPVAEETATEPEATTEAENTATEASENTEA
ncbi:MAG: 30S ribosomal protein S16, partial [Bacteroidia bacterium]|nr:30S ribosomal protein S16 [Bacteroidia bacterium]